MKKLKLTALILALAALISLLAACSCGTKEEEQQSAVPEYSRDLLGDWYGVFAVTESGGIYRDNAGITNDCVMRAAVTDGNTGVCYLVINGVGDKLLKDCAATFGEDTIVLKGTVEGKKIDDWTFRRLGDKLSMSAVFGDSTDYMKLDITLRHCGDEWSGDIIPAGYEYTLKYGFRSLVTVMGGDPAKLPQLSGKNLNLRLTTDEAVPGGSGSTRPSFDDPDRIISANGFFSIRLPEGFAVVRNDAQGFEIANEAQGVNSVTYDAYTSNEDALARLIREAGETGIRFWHYTVDGYDCYAAVMKDVGFGSDIVLFGDDGSGRMLEIHYRIDGDTESAEAMLGQDPGLYYSAVLSAMVRFGG